MGECNTIQIMGIEDSIALTKRNKIENNVGKGGEKSWLPSILSQKTKFRLDHTLNVCRGQQTLKLIK